MEVTVEGNPAATESPYAPVDDPDRFRAVLARFATGVGVMTTVVDGRQHGMTANAFSSVSLTPPLVLVCVERDTAMAESVLAGRVFAVSFLAADQESLSQWFADPARARGEAQFDGVVTELATTGAAVLRGAAGWVDCRLWASYEGGDHLIMVGEVVDLSSGEASDPLLYHRSRYHRIAKVAEHDDSSPSTPIELTSQRSPGSGEPGET